MQKEMATIEQVAQDNHERARRLMKELNQMQHEYTELKKQVRAQEPLLAARNREGPVDMLTPHWAVFVS